MKIKILVLVFISAYTSVFCQNHKEIEALLQKIEVQVYKNYELGLGQNSIFKLIQVYDNITDPKQKADADAYLGMYYSSIFDSKMAISYINKALDGYANLEQWDDYSYILKTIIDIYRFTATINPIEPMLLKAYKITQTQTIGYHKLFVLQELCVYYSYDTPQYDKAIYYGEMFFNDLKYYNTLNINTKRYNYLATVDAEIVSLQLGQSYLYTKQYDKAFLRLERARAFFEPVKDNEKLARVYAHLLKWAIDTNQDKAVISNYYENSSIQFKESTRFSVFMLNEYLKKAIAAKKAEEQSKIEIKERLNLIVLFTLILALAFAIIYYRLKQKINKKEVNRLKIEKELSSQNAFIEGEEKERKRIAEDLHDNINGNLAVVKYKLNSFNLKEAPETTLKDTITILDECIDDIRNMSHNISPSGLLHFDLPEAIKIYANRISSSGNLDVDFQYYGKLIVLEKSKQLIVYRIIQEVLNNVLKHAHASNVIIQLVFNTNTLSITIEDDGVGFDTTTVTNGLGLANIKSRVALINGTYEVISDQKGTTTEILIDS